jgi:hypothetical protein
MKNYLLLFLLICILNEDGFAQIDTSSLTKTHWLVGTWKGVHNGKPFFETWRKKDDNSLICYSLQISKGDTSLKLNSLIRLKGNVVVFEDPAFWKAKRLMENEMTFELINKQGNHRIIWMKTVDNHWWAILQFPLATMYYDLVNMPDLDKAVNKYIPK